MSAAEDLPRVDPAGLIPAPESAVLSPDTGKGPGLSVLILLVLANLACFMAFLTPAFLTIAIRVQIIDPEGASESLSRILAVGAVVGILGTLLFGRLSDRTRSRYGRRRPWMLAGILVALTGNLVASQATGMWGVMLGYCIAMAGGVAALAALAALLPDQIPPHQRGKIGGWMGVGQAAAATLGSGIVALNPTSNLWMFTAPPAVAVVTIVLLCVVLPDRVITAPRSRFSVAELASSFWFNPRRQPDFGWVWLSRLLVFVGVTLLLSYQAYYLMSRIGVNPAEIAQIMFGVLLLENAAGIVASLVAGWLSDRLGRRKIFVGYSALLAAAGFVVLAFSQTMPMFLVGATLLGLAQGAYIAVDLALATDILPAAEHDAARNMGLITVASLLANFVAPAIAPALLGIGSSDAVAPGVPAGNYPVLFAGAAIFMIVGAIVVRPIRGAR